MEILKFNAMGNQRSTAYPAYTLQSCIALVNTIYNEYGTSTLINRDQIAAILKVKEVSVQMRVSSAVQYGLLERKMGEGYKPSSAYLNIYKPLSDEEKLQALTLALSKPVLYQKLLSEIGDGALVPSANALATILFRRHGIIESASKLAAEVFINNLKFVGVVDEQNHLKLTASKADVPKDKVDGEQVREDNVDVIPPSDEPVIKNKEEFREINVPLTSRKKAVLFVPIDFNSKDIGIIKAQLDVVALALEE